VFVEFCIVGLFVVWIVDFFGVLCYFVGGVVVYLNEVKVELLGVLVVLIDE